MRNRKPLKLKTILILFMTIVVFVALGVSGYISFQLFEESMVENIGESRVDVLSQISEKVSAVKSNAEVCNLYYYNANLSEIYHGEEYSEEEQKQIEDNFARVEELSAVSSGITELKFYYTFLVNNGYVYSTNPGASYSLQEYESRIWFPEVLEKREKWISTYKDGEGKDVISIARNLKDREGNYIGLFLFNLYEENLSRVYRSLTDANDIYIVI